MSYLNWAYRFRLNISPIKPPKIKLSILVKVEACCFGSKLILNKFGQNQNCWAPYPRTTSSLQWGHVLSPTSSCAVAQPLKCLHDAATTATARDISTAHDYPLIAPHWRPSPNARTTTSANRHRRWSCGLPCCAWFPTGNSSPMTGIRRA